MIKLLPRDLQLGDLIDLEFADNAFATALVFKVTAEFVVARRPYMAHAGFTCSGGEPNSSSVIVYIGHEDVTFMKSSERPLKVVRRATKADFR